MNVLSELRDLDVGWAERLKQEDCPPLLGLAPLPTHDVQEVADYLSGLFSERPASYRFELLVDLVGRFPAIMALWLARKAGEAYEYGAFWKQFSEAIAFDIPVNKREVLTLAFQIACRRVLPEHIGPPGTGVRI